MQGQNIEINNNNEYVEYGDTRNRKALIGYGYSKHNKGIKEKARIYYTRMNREIQSLLDQEKNKKKKPILKDIKSNKRILKKISINEKDYENNFQKIVKKQKKKKIPKKDRIRF